MNDIKYNKNNNLIVSSSISNNSNLLKSPISKNVNNINNKLGSPDFYFENNTVTLSIQGIATNIKEHEFLNLLGNSIYLKKNVFVNKQGYCLGWAFFDFENKEDAKIFIKIIEEINLTWGLKLKTRYKKPQRY